MMLTIRIAEDALSCFKLEPHIMNGTAKIDGIRFGASPPSGNYLTVSQDGHDVLLTHQSDEIRVFDAELTNVANTILGFSERLELLASDLKELVTSGAPLQSLVERSFNYFQNPIFIIDETNTIRARTNHIAGTVNDDWDYIVEYGRMPLDKVRAIYNSGQRDWLNPARLTKPFLYEPPGMAVRGINFRIPSADGSRFIGTLIIIENETPVTIGMLQYSSILSDAVTKWVAAHQGERLLNTVGDTLSDLLSGVKIPAETLQALEHMIHPPGGSYRLACAVSQDAMRISQYLHDVDEKLARSVCCEHGDFLVMLFDDAQMTENIRILDQLFKGIPVAIGISNPFSELKLCVSCLLQAQIAVRCGNKKISELNAESVMRYIAAEASSVLSAAELVHPALRRLSGYDAKHGTHMYETLCVFLRNERRLSDSLLELGIHRNSLIYRLERIQQIAGCNLDDADTREWLIFSFRMAENL